jgi:hypothetical protein
MSIQHTPENASSRRAFITGATAAGISAIVASRVPLAAAATSTAFPQPLTGLKLTCILRRRSDLTLAGFNDYWLNKHAPLATACVKQLGAYRYVQTHLQETSLNTLLRTARGQVGPPYDGVTEVWFPSEAALTKAMSTPAGVQANLRLETDEPHFIDLPNSSYFFSTEYLCLGDATPTPCDTSTEAAIGSTRFVRTHSGSRRLDVTLDIDHTVSAAGSLQRGSRVLGRAHAASLKPGTPTLTLDIADQVAAGHAQLQVVLKDTKGNTTLAGKRVTIPRR